MNEEMVVEEIILLCGLGLLMYDVAWISAMFQ